MFFFLNLNEDDVSISSDSIGNLVRLGMNSIRLHIVIVKYL